MLLSNEKYLRHKGCVSKEVDTDGNGMYKDQGMITFT